MVLIIVILMALLSAPGAQEAWMLDMIVPPAHAQVVNVSMYSEAADLPARPLHVSLRNTMDCSPANRRNCAEYVLSALQEIMPDLTINQLLGIVYQNELATLPVWARKTAAQALARGFFDAQSGGCPFDPPSGTNACDLDGILDWLSTMQGFVDRVTLVDDQILVNIPRLLGFSDGYQYWARFLHEQIDAHFVYWRTGQGYGLPSTWGLTCIPTGEDPQGLVFVDIVEGQRENCTIHFLIVGPGNRHTVDDGS